MPRKRIIRRKKCVICDERYVDHKNIERVCRVCDGEMKVQEAEFNQTQEATKRKCRECRTSLPATRYFKCYTCQPPHTVDNEDIYLETMPCYGGYAVSDAVNDLRVDSLVGLDLSHIAFRETFKDYYGGTE